MLTHVMRVLAGCGLALAVVWPVPAMADGWGDVDCDGDSTNPECEVGAGTGDDGGEAPDHDSPAAGGCQVKGQTVPCQRDGRTLGDDGCYYAPFNDKGVTRPDDVGKDWTLYMRVCYSGDNIIDANPIWLEESPMAVTPQMLAREAVSKLRLPSPTISVSPTGAQLVSLPSWMWLEAGSWQDQQATASVPGMSVTATASPTTAVWSMGEGGSVTCQGRGTAWKPGADPKASSPDCGYTYRTTSADAPGGQFHVSVSVNWQVSWSGAGTSGTEPDLTTTGAANWPVKEVQTVITR